MVWPLSSDKKQPMKGPLPQVFSPAASPLIGGWGRMDHTEFQWPVAHQPQSYWSDVAKALFFSFFSLSPLPSLSSNGENFAQTFQDNFPLGWPSMCSFRPKEYWEVYEPLKIDSYNRNSLRLLPSSLLATQIQRQTLDMRGRKKYHYSSKLWYNLSENKF